MISVWWMEHPRIKDRVPSHCAVLRFRCGQVSNYLHLCFLGLPPKAAFKHQVPCGAIGSFWEVGMGKESRFQMEKHGKGARINPHTRVLNQSPLSPHSTPTGAPGTRLKPEPRTHQGRRQLSTHSTHRTNPTPLKTHRTCPHHSTFRQRADSQMLWD